MKKYLELLLVLATMAGGFTFMFTTFATAADFKQLEGKIDGVTAIVLGESIQRKMFRHCESPNTELLSVIERDRLRYQGLTGEALVWICAAE